MSEINEIGEILFSKKDNLEVEKLEKILNKELKEKRKSKILQKLSSNDMLNLPGFNSTAGIAIVYEKNYISPLPYSIDLNISDCAKVVTLDFHTKSTQIENSLYKIETLYKHVSKLRRYLKELHKFSNNLEYVKESDKKKREEMEIKFLENFIEKENKEVKKKDERDNN